MSPRPTSQSREYTFSSHIYVPFPFRSVPMIFRCTTCSRSARSAHRDGYPHLHTILAFESRQWPIRRHLDRNGKISWRLTHYQTKQQEFERLWGKGWVDVKAVTNPRHALNYIMGYVAGDRKNALADFSLSLTYLYRKRSFSVSSH